MVVVAISLVAHCGASSDLPLSCRGGESDVAFLCLVWGRPWNHDVDHYPKLAENGDQVPFIQEGANIFEGDPRAAPKEAVVLGGVCATRLGVAEPIHLVLRWKGMRLIPYQPN